MFGQASCFELRLRIVGSHEPKSSDKFVRCAKSSSRIRSSKTSPTHSRLKLAAACVLLTSAAAFLHADSRVVKRWPLAGDPHGIAIGTDGTLYAGLAQPQAVVAIDPETGTTKRRVVLDSPDIASTKELVTLRIDAAGKRLFIANGSDESATILALPALTILREITIEGEAIRDALPDPNGRYLYVLGRRVHVYDFDGEHELRTIAVEDPTAIAASASRLAVFDRNGFTMYDTTNFAGSGHHSLPATVEAATFAGNALFAAAAGSLFEISGNTIVRDSICLPKGSGPQITTPAGASLILLAERTCNSSAFMAANRSVIPASLYGVDAYALAYDARKHVLYTTERAGYLTIYRVPSPRIANSE